MGKIKQFNNDYRLTEAYSATLSGVIDKLENFEIELNELIVGLAVSGKWKEWSDQQPIGTIFEFTEEMLKDTGDINVDAIAGLKDEVMRIKNKLKNGR